MKTVIRNSYTPQIGDYCETIVVDRESGFKYLFDCDGVYTRSSIGEIIEDLDGYREAHKDTDVFSTGGTLDAIDYYVGEEAAAREAADEELEQEIEDLRNNTDVVDIVGTYAELQAYDTSKLGDNDIIKVLQDESRDNATTYYKWHIASQTWEYIGEQGPFYTQDQTDNLLALKQDKLTAGENITIDQDNVISATGGLSPEIVAELPVTGDEKKLYLVPLETPGAKFHRDTGRHISIVGGIGGTEIDVDVDGNLVQSGTPTPNDPKPITVVDGPLDVMFSGTPVRQYRIDLEGKNLYNVDAITTGQLNNDGTVDTTKTSYRVTDFMRIPGNPPFEGTFVITVTSGTASIRLCQYDENFSYISDSYVTGSAGTAAYKYSGNLAYGAKYIRFSFSQTYADRFQVEIGNTATEYVAWRAPYYLADYGSYKNFVFANVPASAHYDPTLIEGALYMHLEVGKFVLDSSNSSSISAYNAANGIYSFYKTGGGDWKIPATTSSLPDVKCDYFPEVASNTIYTSTPTEDYGIAIGSSAYYLYIRHKDITDVNTFRTWVDNHPITIYYPLKTPKNVHITDPTLVAQFNALDEATIPDGNSSIDVWSGYDADASLEVEYYAADPEQMYEEYVWLTDHYERIGPPTLVAGDNIDITHNVISAHMTLAPSSQVKFNSDEVVSSDAIKRMVYAEGTGTYTGQEAGVNIEYSNPTSSTYVSIGSKQTTAPGSNAVRIGSNSVSSGTSSVTIGNSASSAGYGDVVIGYLAKSSSSGDTVVIGERAGGTNTGQQSVSVGEYSAAKGNSSTALGYYASVGTSGTGSVVVGHDPNTANSVTYAVAVGDSAKVNSGGANSVALGYQATVNSNIANAVALGPNSKATVGSTVSVGDGTASTPLYRRIMYVANGEDNHDAVNLSQLNSATAVMTGATASTTGAKGLVPAPAAGDQNKYLKGDGTWADSKGGLTELAYGTSTWNDFITAYQAKDIVYCRASSNADPGTGTQGRKAFMAYVNNADNPTEVEFQYVRSVSTKTSSQPVDQVFVYKLTNASGGTWTVESRNMAPKLAAGTNASVSYSNGTYTVSATDTTYSAFTGATSGAAGTAGLVPAPAAGDQGKFLQGDGTWATVQAGPTVVQTTGQSTTDVMSQKAVTDIIGNVETILQTLNSGNGAQ